MLNSTKYAVPNARRFRLLPCSICLLALCIGSANASGLPNTIAGLQPDRRPPAPTVAEVTRNEIWYARALTGIEQPYPWSLQFIHQQGNWHTPFTKPGMTGMYDIRGWHQNAEGQQRPQSNSQPI